MYGTVTEADAYHAARGNTAWTGDNTVKTAALVRASDYIDGRYRCRLPSGRWQSMFTGEKTGGRTQEREWPRTGATDYEGNEIPSDEVPIEVEHAAYEAALRELTSPGSLSPDYVPSQLVTKEKVDVIEVTYSEPQPSVDGSMPNRPVITAVDEILAPLLRKPADFPAVRVV